MDYIRANKWRRFGVEFESNFGRHSNYSEGEGEHRAESLKEIEKTASYSIDANGFESLGVHVEVCDKVEHILQ